MATEKKKQIVAELSEKLKRAEAVYLTDYQGMSVPEISDLRSRIKKHDADYTVVKNTLFEIAIRENKDSELSNVKSQLSIVGPTAIILAYADPIKPLHIFTKEHKNRLKSALAFGEYLTGASLKKLLDLESEEILRGKLVSQFAAPLYGFARALNWNMQRLATVVNEIEKNMKQNPKNTEKTE